MSHGEIIMALFMQRDTAGYFFMICPPSLPGTYPAAAIAHS